MSEEMMLAQEQGVLMRGAGLKKEMEGGFAEQEGTLILTDRQLVFVTTDEREERFYGFHLIYSDVKDLASVPHVPANTFIPLSSISSATGHGSKGGLERPSLEIKWNEGGKELGRVFIETLSGRTRRKNLNDWARVIQCLKTGEQKLISIPRAPTVDSLQGKVMLILADMQSKGLLTIENEVETAFKIKLDPDEVQTACDALVSQGLVKLEPSLKEDPFYRKASPLGEDELADY